MVSRERVGKAFRVDCAQLEEQTIQTEGREETLAFGRKLSLSLKPTEIILLQGDLGAGKTTLAQGLIAAWTATPVEEIQSPTFTYMIEYGGTRPLYHFDLYRFTSEEQFAALGFLDYLGHGMCCIEWPERVSWLKDKATVHIQITHAGEQQRIIEVQRV